MPNVTFNGNTYSCAKAFKGPDYIHLVDSDGAMTIAFDGVTDFSGFSITDGNWSTPSSANCCVAMINEDGTIVRGGRAANTIVLTVSGWSDNAQTVSLSEMTSTKNVIVSPAPDSYKRYSEAGVYCSAQGNGTLTFRCIDIPIEDLEANILIIGG